MSHFYGKSAKLPLNHVFALNATSLGGTLSPTQYVYSWDNFQTKNTPTPPSFGMDGQLPYVQFRNQYVESSTQLVANYGYKGGSTVILFCRYMDALNQFERSINHLGFPENGSHVFEWIVAETPSAIHPKYFYNSFNSANTGFENVSLNKWTLWVARWTNSSRTSQLFKNNQVISTYNGHPLLNNITMSSIYSGGNMDLHYAAIYDRPLSNTELTNVYNSFVGYIQP